MSTTNDHILPLSVKDTKIRDHPLFVPILNAMLECSVAGIKGEGSLPNRNLILPFSMASPLDPSPLDQFMFDALESQWTHKTELELLHNSVQDFCKTANYNLTKTTTELLKCNTEDIEERSSSFKLSAPFLPDPVGNSQTCFPPPPISVPEMTIVPTQQLLDLNAHTSNERQQETPTRKRKGKKNAKSLPKEARAILKAWILEHWENPYPDEATKKMLVKQTGLVRSQVVNWFINARRRLIRPMKEQLEREKKEKLRMSNESVNMSPGVHVESAGSVDSDRYFSPCDNEPPAKKAKTNGTPPYSYPPHSVYIESSAAENDWKQPRTIALQELEMGSHGIPSYPPNVFTPHYYDDENHN